MSFGFPRGSYVQLASGKILYIANGEKRTYLFLRTCFAPLQSPTRTKLEPTMQAFHPLLLSLLANESTMPADLIVRLQTGDIIIKENNRNVSHYENMDLDSSFSMIGMIIIDKEDTYVLEVDGTVKYTPFFDWEQKNDEEFKVYRYCCRTTNNTQQTGLTKEEQKQVIKLSKQYLNKPQDLTFDWSDEQFYDTELIWKIYDNIGLKLSDSTIRTTRKERRVIEKHVGNPTPTDTPIVLPRHIMNSKKINVVYPNNPDLYTRYLLGYHVAGVNPLGEQPTGWMSGVYFAVDATAQGIAGVGVKADYTYDFTRESHRVSLLGDLYLLIFGGELGVVSEFTQNQDTTEVLFGPSFGIRTTLFNMSSLFLQWDYIPKSTVPWRTEFGLQTAIWVF